MELIKEDFSEDNIFKLHIKELHIVLQRINHTTLTLAAA